MGLYISSTSISVSIRHIGSWVFSSIPCHILSLPQKFHDSCKISGFFFGEEGVLFDLVPE